MNHRLGLHDLLNAGQLDRLRRIAVGQGDLAVIGCVQRLGNLAVVGILLDQQVLVTFQRLDFFPVQRNIACIFGVEQQLATVEDLDGPGQLVTVLQPDGIGE